MGGGKGTTTTRSDIPPELRPLYQEGATHIRNAQRNNPISDYTNPGAWSGAFQTASRAPQFGQAQTASQVGQQVAHTPLASRQGINQTPAQTLASVNTAQQAVGSAGNIPGQFAQLSPVARRNVGLQSLERAAVNRAGGIQDVVRQTPETYGEVRSQADPRLADLVSYGDRQVTGANLQQDPAYQAAIQAFEAAQLPAIQNSAALSGLGRTTGLQQSIAAGQAQYLLPVIQDTLAREERGIDRGLGTRQFSTQMQADLGLQEAMAQERGLERYGQAGQFAAGLESDIGGRMGQRAENRIGREMEALMQQGLAGERGIGRTQDAMRFLSGQQQFAGQQDLSRALEGLYSDERSRGLQYQSQQDAYANLMNLGQSEQDYAQGGLDRQTQDFLRRQGLSETALYGPFGQIAPSSIAQQSASSKK